MAKLTKAEFNQMQKAEAPPQEAPEKEKTDMIAKVYDWQQFHSLYAWDEESLHEELGMSIQGFTLAGENESGDPIEVEFRRPLDEDIENQGVACGFKLIRVQEDGPFYTLEKLQETPSSETPSETSEEGTEASEDTE